MNTQEWLSIQEGNFLITLKVGAWILLLSWILMFSSCGYLIWYGKQAYEEHKAEIAQVREAEAELEQAIVQHSVEMEEAGRVLENANHTVDKLRRKVERVNTAVARCQQMMHKEQCVYDEIVRITKKPRA